MDTKLRLKKYSYVSISTAFMWLALFSIMIPKFTPVAIVTILVIMLLKLGVIPWRIALERD